MGKVLSNFAMLMVIESVLFISAIIVQLVHGDPHINFLALFLPFLFVALPAMATISALALLFETLPGLRSGLGNLIFVFLWFFMIFRITTYNEMWLDLPGLLYFDRVFSEAAEVMEIPFDGGFSIEGGSLADPFARYVRWENLSWINEMIGWRLYWLGLAICLTLLAAIFFDRFESRNSFFHLIHWSRRKASHEYLKEHKIKGLGTNEGELSIRKTTSKIQLSPITKTLGSIQFGRIFWLEVRMILKRPWWWYLISLWLLAMSLLVPIQDAHTFWVPVIWLWLALVLSEMGTREVRYNTVQIVFSIPYPLRHHFFATWLAGFIATVIMGIAGLRLLLIGESEAALAWGIATIFISCLALFAGVLGGNRRFFEGIYSAWWLMGPMAKEGTALDFMGIHKEVVARGIHWFYLIASIILLALAFLGRWRKLCSL
jgi:hypothetical protein